MNKKNLTRFISRIFIVVTIFIAGLFQSCDTTGETYIVDNKETTTKYYYIDTLNIHGVKHEFIYSVYYYNSGGLGICHSPECWCLKEKNHDDIKPNDKIGSEKVDEEYVKKKFIDWLFQEDNSQRIDIYAH